MSYDTVALVAAEPDERAVVGALRRVDQGLLLHRYRDDTDILQVRDADGSLVATFEPAQRVENRGEVDRLLGSDAAAGLPDPCWWVEIRARPDAKGRAAAHGLADGLVLRLGGTVWTSDSGSADLWEETEHPTAERAVDRALLVVQDRPVVPFSSWLADAVATQAGRRTLQVLTPAASRLSHATRVFVASALGRWVVRGDSGGHYDGLTGLPVRWNERHGFLAGREPAGPGWDTGASEVRPVPGFVEQASSLTGTKLVIDASVTHPLGSGPSAGRAVETVARHLARTAPAGWGPHEPALRHWDRGRMTAFARRRGPRPTLLHFAGPYGSGHPFSGQVRVSWRGEEALERISLAVDFEDEGAVPFEALPDLVTALAEEECLVGLRVRRTAGSGDGLYAPVWSGPALPVGTAVGAGRLERAGHRRAQAGPIRGTLLGPKGRKAAWYPVPTDAEAPLGPLALSERQDAYLASVMR